jgi:crotonobetaine/carnitine-CoA ligase
MDREYATVNQSLHPSMRAVDSVAEVVESAADVWGDDPFMTYAPTGETYTFSRLHERTNRIANALDGIGVDRDDRVGLFLTNGPDYVCCIHACAKLGAIETPINWQYRERETRHAIDSAGISTVVADPTEDIDPVLSAVAPDADSLESVVGTEAGTFEDLDGVDTYALPEIEAEATSEPPGASVDSEDPMAILYTSGTTGLPKPTALSHESFLLASKSFLGASLAGPNYNPYPLFHANNQCYSMLGSLVNGTEYVLSDAFSASEFWDEVTENDVTSFNLIGGVPKILDSTYDEDEIPDNDLRQAIGPISGELWEHFEEKFDLSVVQIYSQTESPTLLMNHPDPDRVRVGALGKPMFPDEGHEAWVIDEDGDEVAPDELGELVRTDPGAMIGYWDQPEKTEETLRDGTIYSGDVVRRDADGYFYYVDRKKFMVRRSGENIAAQEVENVIDELPGVVTSAIIPVPDEFRGEEVKAAVKRRDDSVDERDVVLHVARNLAPYKVPRYVEFVDEFPQTPTERIQRVRMADEEKERDDHGWDRQAAFDDWESHV